MKKLSFLLSIPIFLILSCMPLHAEPPNHNAEVNRVFTEIKKIAQETVQSGQVKTKGLRKTGESYTRIIYNLNMACPSFEIDLKKKELYYSRGRIMGVLSGFKEDEPWFPLAMQIQLELHTEIFDKLPGGKSIWAPYKEEGENYIVKPNIRALLFSPPNSEIDINEAEDYERFFDKTALAFDQVARINGLKAVNDEGYGGVEDMLKVEVVTEPPGGLVKVIPILAYKVYQSLGRSPDLWPWNSLLRNTELLLGKYRYVVTWPDGSIKEGQLELKYKDPNDKKPEKITFKR
jgi:hypothetical protein